MAVNEPSKLARGLWKELERLAQVFGRVGPEEACCEGLTQRQTAVLRTLVEREGSRIRDLAEASEVTAGAMTRIIERLEARGLVVRVRGTQQDRREAMVRITDEGRCLRQQIDQLMLQRAESLWQAMAAKTRRNAVQALHELNDAFAKAGCCPLNQPVARLSVAKRNSRNDEP